MSELIEKEIKEIARLIAGLEHHAKLHDTAIDKQIEFAEQIFSDFNKKYPKLTIKIAKNIDSIEINLFINEQNVKDVFTESASKLKGMTGIGLNSFDEATIQEGDKFAILADKISTSILLTYSLDFGTETVILEYNDKEKKVELNFEIKSIANPFTPQHQILAHYAMKQQGEDIDILTKCYQLGFIDIEDAALFEWEDDYYPKMLE